MMSDLKPCPFCGNKYSLMSGEMAEGSYILQPGFVFCCECGAEISERKTEAEAIEAWNRRTEPELKKGKWMEKETFDNADYEIPVWQSARCSVCGKYMTAPYQYYFTDFSYCPNCGSYNGDDNEK